MGASYMVSPFCENILHYILLWHVYFLHICNNSIFKKQQQAKNKTPTFKDGYESDTGWRCNTWYLDWYQSIIWKTWPRDRDDITGRNSNTLQAQGIHTICRVPCWASGNQRRCLCPPGIHIPEWVTTISTANQVLTKTQHATYSRGEEILSLSRRRAGVGLKSVPGQGTKRISIRGNDRRCGATTSFQWGMTSEAFVDTLSNSEPFPSRNVSCCRCCHNNWWL